MQLIFRFLFIARNEVLHTADAASEVRFFISVFQLV